MSEWMNRVKTKPVMVANDEGGEVAIYESEFAYQPYRCGIHADEADRMARKYLGPSERAWDKKGNPDVLALECYGKLKDMKKYGVVNVWRFKRCSGVWYSGNEPKIVGQIEWINGKPVYFRHEELANA
jgi:hypothetical protein